MSKYFRNPILIFALLVVSVSLHANEYTHPQALMESVTEDILGVLKQGETNADAKGFIENKVSELILPKMDFVAMSKLVLGKHWRNASAEQRTDFVDQFRNLLIRTYSRSLSEYSDQTVKFLAFRETSQPQKKAVVKSQIVRSAGPPIPINYSLRFKDKDGWKVYDIGIEGISLVTNYRSSFSRQVTDKGIDYLIDSLRSRNESKT